MAMLNNQMVTKMVLMVSHMISWDIIRVTLSNLKQVLLRWLPTLFSLVPIDFDTKHFNQWNLARTLKIVRQVGIRYGKQQGMMII
jgi:hypothetical protein